MSNRPKQSIAQQLTAGQLIISNSLEDGEIQEYVAEFGYNSEKLSEGTALYAAAQAAVNQQTAKAGAQQTATQALTQAESAARDAYQALAKVARAVFSKAQLTTLGLSGVVPKDIAGFLSVAYTLFNNAASLPELANYGYNTEKIQGELQKIQNLDAVNQNQEMAKGAAQQATREQDAALQALNDWVGQYRKIAKVALREKKQLLEKLGIVARTSKTPAQRAAAAKASATRAAKKAG
jgi:transglutaminase/protease-like cytokinesis protein 3